MNDQPQRPAADKPYRRYQGGHARRTPLDDELAGLRPASERGRRPSDEGGRRRPSDGSGRRRPSDGGSGGDSGKGYRRYGSSPGGTSSRRRRFRWWHIPLGLLVLLVVAGVVGVVLAYPGYKRFDKAVDASNRRIGPEATAALDPNRGLLFTNPTTVLLLGVDSKQGEPARSDTILLMRFDPDEGRVNQLSIPRDTLVDIPGHGQDKINAAMYQGGPELAIETVREYLGIPINHVMVVNFKGFPRLVNSVGGVDMYVPRTVETIASRDRVVVYEKGWQHFDGKNAMLYVRIRAGDDDFHRARRQQQFVVALQRKIAQPSNLPRLPEIGRRFMSGVDTDLTTTELLQLGWVKWRADEKKGRKLVMAGEPYWQGGVAYVLPPADDQKARMLDRFLGE
jgi:LCP family protein required for cell wall assembly